MSNQLFSNTPQDSMLQLEIVPQDEQQTDIADIDEVSREIVHDLRVSGYTVEPIYQATKGFSIFDIIINLNDVINHHEALLAALLTCVSSILQSIMKILDHFAEKRKTPRDSFEVTLEINGKPLTIKATDVESAANFIEKVQSFYPEITNEVPKQMNMKTKVHVPKKRRIPKN